MKHMMENTWDREWVRETEKRVNARMMDMKNTGMEEKFPVSLIDMDCWEWPQGVACTGCTGIIRWRRIRGFWSF
ncbi:hypothetical protein [Enterocloster asparagiformis]|uniref:hypothetical protein n=1 Tax=Enterocloster asparagiformis TaxID=333367 RepID=UPI0004B80B1C|nr:hypothetical protein [Enterocloster asparagiformis]